MIVHRLKTNRKIVIWVLGRLKFVALCKKIFNQNKVIRFLLQYFLHLKLFFISYKTHPNDVIILK